MSKIKFSIIFFYNLIRNFNSYQDIFVNEITLIAKPTNAIQYINEYFYEFLIIIILLIILMILISYFIYLLYKSSKNNTEYYDEYVYLTLFIISLVNLFLRVCDLNLGVFKLIIWIFIFIINSKLLLKTILIL